MRYQHNIIPFPPVMCLGKPKVRNNRGRNATAKLQKSFHASIILPRKTEAQIMVRLYIQVPNIWTSLWIIETSSSEKLYPQISEWDKVFYFFSRKSGPCFISDCGGGLDWECWGERVSETGNSLWSAENVEMESSHRHR